MKTRRLRQSVAFTLVLAMLLGLIPNNLSLNVFAQESNEVTACELNDKCTLANGHDGDCVYESNVELQNESGPCTLVDGCTLTSGHEGACVVATNNEVSLVDNNPCTLTSGCELLDGHDGECQVPKVCETGCTLESGHDGDCILPKVCETGCTLEQGHDGDCVLPKTHLEGCILESTHDGDCFVKCTLNENCTLNNGHSEQCLIEDSCEEGCILESEHDGDCVISKTCETGCILDQGHDGDCFIKCTINNECTLNNGHDGDCVTDSGCEEGCILESGHDGDCFIPCDLDNNCTLNKGHDGDCVIDTSCKKTTDCIRIDGHKGNCIKAEEVCNKTDGCIKKDGHLSECTLEEEVCDLSDYCALKKGHDDECLTEQEIEDIINSLNTLEELESTISLLAAKTEGYFKDNLTISVSAVVSDNDITTPYFRVNMDLSKAIINNDVAEGQVYTTVTNEDGDTVEIIRLADGFGFSSDSNLTFDIEFTSKEERNSDVTESDTLDIYTCVGTDKDDALANKEVNPTMTLVWKTLVGMGYDIEMRWVTNNEDEWYNIKRVETDRYSKPYVYSVTLATSGVDYEDGQIELKIPYYLYADNTHIYSEDYTRNGVKPSEISLPGEDTVVNGLYYTIDDNGTADIYSDDMMVVRNKGTMYAGTTIMFRVSYNVFPSELIDLYKTTLKTTAKCKSTIDSDYVTKESNELSLCIDTGVKYTLSEQYSKNSFKFECLYTEPDDISETWDFENYNYIKVYYETALTGSSLAKHTIEYEDLLNGSDAELVLVKYDRDNNNTNIDYLTPYNNKAVYTQQYANEVLYDGVDISMYVRYPKNVISFQPKITGSLLAIDDDTHTPPEDMNDTAEMVIEADIFPWVSYEIPTGELVYRDIQFYPDKYTPQLSFLTGLDSKARLDTEYKFNGHYVQYQEGQDIELYVDNIILQSESGYEFVDSSLVEFNTSSSIKLENYTLNHTNGKTTYEDINTTAELYARVNGQWVDAGTVAINSTGRTSQTVTIDTDVNYPDGTDAVKLVIKDIPNGYMYIDWHNEITLNYNEDIRAALTEDSDIRYIAVMGSKHFSDMPSGKIWDDKSDTVAYANGENYLTDSMKSDITSKDISNSNYGGDTSYYILRDNDAVNCDTVPANAILQLAGSGLGKNNAAAKRFESDISFETTTYKYISNSEWSNYDTDTKENIANDMMWETAIAYVLLPPYVHFDSSKDIEVTGIGSSTKRVSVKEIISNYKNTGREMVLFNLSHDNVITELDIGSENVYNRVDFDFGTYVDWADFEYLPSGMQSVYAALIIDKPRENENYKLDSNSSYKVNNIQVFEDLINNGVYDDNVALYDTNGYDYNEVASKEVGISKRVKTSSGVYAHSGNVGLDEIYTYYIAISNSDTGSLNNLIIYDIIEEAALDNEESWKGTFESIDISSLQDMGCQPIVYYSTTQGLRYPEQLTTGAEYIWLNDSSVWSTTCPADKSTITAIAVDARKKSDSSSFNVPAGDSLGFSFSMKAPSELPSLTNPNALYAYNRPAYSCSFKATSNGIANWTSLIGSRVTVGIPTTTVEVQKIWEDFDNLYQKRPDSVNVQLKRNNVNIGSAITLDESNNWIYTFENLLELDSNGDRYVYSVEEVNVPTDYDCTYTGTMSSGLKVINTINEVKVDVEITKIWNDFYNKNNKRPSKIVLTLIGDEGKSTELIQDVELTGRTSTWKTTVSVPKYNTDGEEFTWTIKEETVPDGYTCSISGDSATGFTVENSLHYNITTKKVWDDFNNKFSTRPDDITLDLYKVYNNGNEELIDTRVISELDYKTNINSGEDFDWSTEPFTDLYYTKEFKYEVRERNVADYEQKYSNTLSSSNGTVEQLWTITNKLDVDMVDISINKVWENIPVENRGLPKFTLSIQGLYGRNDEITSYRMSGTEVKKDNYTFKIEVPKYIIDDIETNYILTETYPYSGVTAEITGNVRDGFNVINKPALRIEVKKAWDDGGNALNTRPEGPIYFDICSVDENDQVIDTIDTIEYDVEYDNSTPRASSIYVPKYNSDGTPIKYKVIERNCPAHYTSNMQVSSSENLLSVLYTNSLDIEKKTINITKIWNDNGEYNDYSYGDIYFNIIATSSGEQYKYPAHQIYTHQITNPYSFTYDVYKYDLDGNELIYAVEEELEKTYGLVNYTYEVIGNADDGFKIINTYNVNIDVKKIWDDYDNVDLKRPNTITFKLYKVVNNNKELLDSKTMYTELYDSIMGFSFGTYPLYDENGVLIEYSVEEEIDKDCYTGASTIKRTRKNSYYDTMTFEFTNEFDDSDIKTVEDKLVIRKIWNDNSNVLGVRPDEVRFIAYADYANPETGYLPEEAAKDKPFLMISMCKDECILRTTNGFILPNSFYTYTTYDNVWELTVDTSSPLYYGSKALYAIDEYTEGMDWVNNYTSTINKIDNNTFECINTINDELSPDIEMRTIDITKTWLGPAVRSTIAVYVYGDRGTPYETVSHHILNLGSVSSNVPVTKSIQVPKYREDGTEIVYTIEEDMSLQYMAHTSYWSNYRDLDNNYSYGTDVPSYDSHVSGDMISGFDIKNIEKIQLQVNKYWKDAYNITGNRPDEIKFNVYKIVDGQRSFLEEATLSKHQTYATLNSIIHNNYEDWEGAIGFYPKYTLDGKLITYELEEQAVDGYANAGKYLYSDGNTSKQYNIDNYINEVDEDDCYSIKIRKEWDDNNNALGKRPDSVTFVLYFIDEYTNRQNITITLQENNFLISSSTNGISGDARTFSDSKYTVTDNVWELELQKTLLTELSVTTDKYVYKSVYTELPILHKDLRLGNYTVPAQYYYIVENDIDGYTSSITGDLENGFKSINTIEDTFEYNTVRITKQWNLPSGKSIVNANSLDLEVKANGSIIKNLNYQNMTSANGNTWYWDVKIPKVDVNGNSITQLDIEEHIALGNYTGAELVSNVSGSIEEGYIVTNTVVYTDIELNKQWLSDKELNIRPDEINLDVYSVVDNTETFVETLNIKESDAKITKSNTYDMWTVKLSVNYPSFTDDGKPIKYIFKEQEIPGYKNVDAKIEFKNTYGNDCTQVLKVINEPFDGIDDGYELDIEKIWIDNDNRRDSRPNAIVFKVNYELTNNTDGSILNKTYRVAMTEDGFYVNRLDGTHQVENIETHGAWTFTSSTNKWNFHQSVKDTESEEVFLPKLGAVLYNNYTVTDIEFEEEPIQDYMTTIEGDFETGFKVTNEWIYRERDIKITKYWYDGGNDHNNRTMSQVTWDLIGDEGTANESTINVYTRSYNHNYNYGTNINYTGDYTDRYINKGWTSKMTNENSADAYSEMVIAVPYYAPDMTVANYTLSEERYANSCSSGQTTLYKTYTTGNMEDGFVVKNIANVHPKLCVYWYDFNNRDGIRPENGLATFNNIVNGQVSGTSTTKTYQDNPSLGYGYSENGVNGSGTDYPRYTQDYELLEYKFEEVLPQGYTLREPTTGEYDYRNTTEYRYDGTKVNHHDNLFYFKNEHIPERLSFEIEKVWDLGYNDAGANELLLVRFDIKTTCEHCGRSYSNYVYFNGTDISTSIYGADISTSFSNNIRHIVIEADTDATYDSLKSNENYVLWKNCCGHKLNWVVTENRSNTNTNFELVQQSGSIEDGKLSFTNLYKRGDIEITGKTVWIDHDNEDGIRPTQHTVKLLGNDTDLNDNFVPTNANEVNNEWEWTAKVKPVWDTVTGQIIDYTIELDSVPDGYTAEISGNYVDGFVVTFIHESMIELKGRWTILDHCNVEGKRPEKVYVEILADGTPTGQRVEIGLSNDKSTYNWDGVFVPKYADGDSEIEYTVAYTAEPDDYSEEHGGTYKDTNGFWVKWEYHPTIEIAITKKFVDNNNAYGVRYLGNYSFTVREVNNITNKYDVVIDCSDSSKNEFTTSVEAYKYDANGNEITYEVIENLDANTTYSYTDIYNPVNTNISVDGYTVTYSGNQTTGFTVTNTENVIIEAIKVWDDMENKEGFRSDNVEFKLYKDYDTANEYLVDTVVLEASKHQNSARWERVIGVLPRYDESGEEIQYSIVETPISNYSVSYTNTVGADDKSLQLTATNKHDVNVYDIPVKVVWDDYDDKLGLRPDSIEAQLKINGVDYSTPLELEKLADETWSESAWTDMSDYTNKEFNNYSVTSTDLSSLGYKIEITGNKNDGFVIKYILRVKETDVKVEWYDFNNKFGVRPDEIEVTLTEDGNTVDSIKKLVENTDGTWTDYTWEDIIATDQNENSVYEVTATDLSSVGYTKTITGNFEDGFVVKYVLEHTVDTTVKVVWEDYNDKLGLRPDSNSAELYQNNVKNTTVANLEEKTDGTWTEFKWTNLVVKGDDTFELISDKFEDLGYKTVVTGNVIDGFVITHTLQLTNLKVTKTWVDENNKYNKRPSEIEVQLYKNNVKHGDTVKLNQANNWQYTFEDLIAWQSGNDVFWTVGEVNIPSGYDASYGYTMTVNGTKEAIIENKYIKPNPKPTDKPEDEPTVEPTATPTVQPTATPVASPTATPQSSPVITPQESPTPGSTDVRPTSTPEYTSVVTMDDALVIQGSVKDAAVLSARRGLDFAILGSRRRPGTGDNAMIDWVMLLLLSAIMASISGYKIKRNKKKQ